MGQMLRILIADDYPLVRAGMAQVLSTEPSFIVVGEAETAESVLDLAVKLYPDVILLGLSLPDASSLEVCRTLVREQPGIKVIILTVFDEDTQVLDYIKAGASGYLLKDIAQSTLIDAVKATCRWGSYIHPSVADKLINEYSKLNARVRGQNAEGALTTREIEVLARVAEGRTNKEIANELYISEKTVKNHITNVFKKLKVSDRTEAVVQAIKRSII